jgi:hypothetical protein
VNKNVGKGEKLSIISGRVEKPVSGRGGKKARLNTVAIRNEDA